MKIGIAGSPRQILASVVEHAITERTDEIDIAQHDGADIEMLREKAYLEDRHLTPKAFCDYFDCYTTIPCQPEVQALVDAFGLTGLRWKLADGFIEDNRSFSDLKVIFLRPYAELHSWFHELGHIVFGRIEGSLLKRLVSVAISSYRTVVNPPGFPEGKYLVLSGNRNGLPFGGLCGLDHHGEDGVDNELWASLFAMKNYGVELESAVQSVIQQIVDSLCI